VLRVNITLMLLFVTKTYCGWSSVIKYYIEKSWFCVCTAITVLRKSKFCTRDTGVLAA